MSGGHEGAVGKRKDDSGHTGDARDRRASRQMEKGRRLGLNDGRGKMADG